MTKLPLIMAGTELPYHMLVLRDYSYDGSPETNVKITYFAECKIDELENKINEIEQREDFIKWTPPIVEQLNEALGTMTDPNNDKFPGCVIYFEYEDLNSKEEK